MGTFLGRNPRSEGLSYRFLHPKSLQLGIEDVKFYENYQRFYQNLGKISIIGPIVKNNSITVKGDKRVLVPLPHVFTL